MFYFIPGSMYVFFWCTLTSPPVFLSWHIVRVTKGVNLLGNLWEARLFWKQPLATPRTKSTGRYSNTRGTWRNQWIRRGGRPTCCRMSVPVGCISTPAGLEGPLIHQFELEFWSLDALSMYSCYGRSDNFPSLPISCGHFPRSLQLWGTIGLCGEVIGMSVGAMIFWRDTTAILTGTPGFRKMNGLLSSKKWRKGLNRKV